MRSRETSVSPAGSPSLPGRLPERDLAGGDLVEDRVHELRLDRDRPLGAGLEAVPELERRFDRLARGLAVEVVDPQQVVEQTRDLAFEAVEERERVLPDREENVRGGVATAERARELALERPAGTLARVVEEVLLELVEHEQQRAARALGKTGEAIDERALGRIGGEFRLDGRDRLAHGLAEGGDGVGGAPRGEGDGDELGGSRGRVLAPRLLAEMPHHPGVEHRALPDPARAVENRDAVGAEVVDDDLAPPVPAEEPVRVRLRVGNEALVGGGPPGRRLGRAHGS